MKTMTILLAAAALAGCSTVSRPPMTLDDVADAYVKATLELDTHEPGYVDAYYGPEALREQAKAHPRTLPDLASEVARLRAAIDAIHPADPMLAARRDVLAAQLRAAATRIRMIGGETLPFDEEARLLYGAAPAHRTVGEFDSILEKLDALVPGEGDVSARVAAYNDRFVIPDDKVKAAILAATEACKAETARHIAMPEGEDFRLELVRDKVWSGYNWYLGNSQSLIQVNLDSDVTPDRAIQLGCHEGYPGHHLFNALLERDLARGKGWREYQVYALYSPQSLIAEGSADYGRKLAFGSAETLAFFQSTLFPLAGFDPAEAEQYLAVVEAKNALDDVDLVILRDYLDGRIDRDAAKALLMKYELRNEKQAERGLAFYDANRAYSINYRTGEELVKQWIDAKVAGGMDRWAAMEMLLSTPVVLGE